MGAAVEMSRLEAFASIGFAFGLQPVPLLIVVLAALLRVEFESAVDRVSGTVLSAKLLAHSALLARIVFSGRGWGCWPAFPGMTPGISYEPGLLPAEAGLYMAAAVVWSVVLPSKLQAETGRVLLNMGNQLHGESRRQMGRRHGK